MDNKCGFCDKKTLSLRRCSGCQQVYYCSTVCQKEDWKKQHKAKCKELQKQNENEQTEIPEDFSYIPNSEPGTGKTLYPSEPANKIASDVFLESLQKNKTRTHFAVDNLSNSAVFFRPNKQNDKETKTQYKTCTVCGEGSITMKTCSRCKKVDYCSRKCQRQDWKTHKLQCKGLEDNGYETITTDGYRREESFASSSARTTDNNVNNLFRPLPDIPDFSHRSYNEPGALDKVKSLTWKAFPGCTILDFVQEIPHELFGIRPSHDSFVAVGFISRYHTYVLRHCIYLQDKDGDEVYVGFYFQRDDPRPYFRWSDVIPGRYLCIKNPYIHQFLDGSVGIKVVDPSNVRAFSV